MHYFLNKQTSRPQIRHAGVTAISVLWFGSGTPQQARANGPVLGLVLLAAGLLRGGAQEDLFRF